jgi:hypothetical protein
MVVGTRARAGFRAALFPSYPDNFAGSGFADKVAADMARRQFRRALPLCNHPTLL